jgi:hypothetical protein
VPSSRGVVPMKKPRWTGAKMAYGHQEDRCSSDTRYVGYPTDGGMSARENEGRDRLSPRFCGGTKGCGSRGALLSGLKIAAQSLDGLHPGVRRLAGGDPPDGVGGHLGGRSDSLPRAAVLAGL